MPRSKKIKCDTCNRTFTSKKYYDQHKCGSENNKNNDYYINCFFCMNIFHIKNINRHEESCKKKFYLETFIFFIKFLFGLILRTNKIFLKNSIVSDEEEKKNIIYKYKKNNIINDVNAKYKKKSEEFQQNLINKLLYKEKKEKEKSDYIKENQIILRKSIENEIDFFNKEGINEIKEEKLYKIKDEKILKYLSNINNGFLPLISIRQIFLDYFNKNKKYDDTSKIIIDYLNKKYIKKDFLTDQEIIKIDINLYNKIKKIRLNSDYYYNKYIFLYNIIEKNFKQRSYYKCEFCNKYMLDKLHHFKNCKELENCFEDKESIIKYIIDNYYINKLYKTNYTIEYYINYYKNKDLKDFFKNINMHIIKNYKFEEYNYIKEFKKNNKYDIFKILSEIEKNKEIEEKNKEIKLDEEEESEEDEEIEQKEINDEILEEKSCDEIIYKIKEMNQPKKINLALEMNPFKNFSNYYKNLINEKRKREEKKKYEKNIKIIYNYKKDEPDILKKRENLDKKYIDLINNK